MRMFLRLGTNGRYSATNAKILLRVFCLFCRTDILSLNLISERVFSKRRLSGYDILEVNFKKKIKK